MRRQRAYPPSFMNPIHLLGSQISCLVKKQREYLWPQMAWRNSFLQKGSPYLVTLYGRSLHVLHRLERKRQPVFLDFVPNKRFCSLLEGASVQGLSMKPF